MADARRVELLDLAPDGRERLVGDRLGIDRAERASRRRRGHEHRRAGHTRTGLLDPRRVYARAIGEHQGVADVFDLLDPAPEHGHARLVVHRAVPGLGDELRVALVATEGVDAQLVTRGEHDVHHRRAWRAVLRALHVGDVVSEIGERRAHLFDRSAGRRGSRTPPALRRRP